MFELILRFFFVIHIFQYVFCHYTDKWAVKVDGDENFAKKIASERGFQFVSEVSFDTSFFLFSHLKPNILK